MASAKSGKAGSAIKPAAPQDPHEADKADPGEMAKVKAKYDLTGKPLTEAGLMRVASYQVTEYWERLRRLTTWLDCGNCSKEQRRKCREQLLYSKCPKYQCP